MRELNLKQRTKKNEYTSGDNITKTHSEKLEKLLTNQSQKLQVMN